MAVTKTSIVSLAVMLVGHGPIQSIDNADDLVTAASQAYDHLLPAVLSTGNWRFACQIQQLTLTAIIPPVGTNWQNVYLLPSGWLKTIRVIPNNYVWDIYQDNLIYTNWGSQSPIYMEFVFQPDESFFPHYFIDYFIYEIACFVALASAQKPDYKAALEATKNVKWAIASAVDAQNRPQFTQVNIPVLNNRNITGIIGPQIG